ncbi:MAG: hypothetical protein EZS28_043080, partial [Streblomastix strix]
TIDTGKCEKG